MVILKIKNCYVPEVSKVLVIFYYYTDDVLDKCLIVIEWCANVTSPPGDNVTHLMVIKLTVVICLHGGKIYHYAVKNIVTIW